MLQPAKSLIIHIVPIGNLGNRMIQYMAALALCNRIPGSRISNVDLPEWNIHIPSLDTGFGEREVAYVYTEVTVGLDAMCHFIDAGNIKIVYIRAYMQRIEYLEKKEYYQSIFVSGLANKVAFDENELLINIRGGDVLEGVPHYPLIPIAFYRSVIAQTGLSPVFAGQIGTNPYIDAVKEAFPDARYIPSMGVIEDFQIIRNAPNIVVSISTFSWIAAWLSNAKQIFLPLSGFLNPAHHREIDLLPVGDQRYRYFLFPLNYGVPVSEALALHDKLAPLCKEISQQQVDTLRRAAPFVKIGPFVKSKEFDVTFDPIWYAHEYIDAAMEISEGWFESPLEHYFGVGWRRGYQPLPPPPVIAPEFQIAPDMSDGLHDIAVGKPALQSSRSLWSVGETAEDDAARANIGERIEPFAFHTDHEYRPWWQVDLLAPHRISQIIIFNRTGLSEYVKRTYPLEGHCSDDGINWTKLFRTSLRQYIGLYGEPLCWTAQHLLVTRFIRISIDRSEYFHLAQVRVLGQAL